MELVRGWLLLQPGPELASTNVAGSEAEATDHRGGKDGHPGHLEAVQMAEEARRVAVDREGVEEAGSGEEGVVGGGDDAGHDHGVDEAAGHGTAGFDEDDGEGAGRGGFG